MKKSTLLTLALCFIFLNCSYAQIGGLLKKSTKSVANEVLGKPTETNTQPEPSCACDPAEFVLDLGGKLQLDYKELSLATSDDGSLLLKHVAANEYYVLKDGSTSGPYKSGDPHIAAFETNEEKGGGIESFIEKYKPYITRSGEKFLITFAGKSYGPYARIERFVVSKSKDKFAATAVETVAATEDQGKRMDEAIKNAKTEQEKRELAMKFSQEMQQRMMQGGGPMSMMPKLITNVPNANIDLMTTPGNISADIKYDDIVISSTSKILDLQGKTLVNLNQQDAYAAEKIFLSSSGTKYAVYYSGKLSFSDGTSLSQLFNPHFVKTDGKIYLAYMYYSPKKNALMQCRIPF
jgi:hypothetical protein